MAVSFTYISYILLFLFYFVGVLCIGMGLKPDLVELSWFNLVATGLIVFLNRTEKGSKFLLFSGVVFLAGLLVEIIGVATGFPFGSYYYGNSLGWKIWEVPLVLGLNWWILVYGSIHLAKVITKHRLIQIILAPALMLGLDTLIEPLCETLDFWYWKNSVIPFENYVSWYIISIVLIGLYFSIYKASKINYMAVVAFVIQVLFFLLLNLFLD